MINKAIPILATLWLCASTTLGHPQRPNFTETRQQQQQHAIAVQQQERRLSGAESPHCIDIMQQLQSDYNCHCLESDDDTILVQCDIPSPSPSGIPTLQPSSTPSVSQQPTTSQQPSMSPTTSEPSGAPTMTPSATPSTDPSSQPTISPAPTITAQPTGFVFLVAKDIEIMFQSVTQKMDSSHIAFFQEETKLFLQQHIPATIPGVLEMEIQAVTVTSQKLVGARRLAAVESTGTKQRQHRQMLQRDNVQNPQALVVSMQVVAMALLDPTEHFDLEVYLDIFFENYDNLLSLRRTLEEEESFSDDIFWQRHSLDNGSNRSMAGPAAGAFFGVTVSFAGLACIMMCWFRRRRQIQTDDDDKPPDELHQMTFSHSYDTDDCLPDSSHPNRFVVDSKTFETRALPSSSKQHPKALAAKEVSKDDDDDDDDTEKNDPKDVEAQSVKEECVGSVIAPPHLMYTPALMTTESNIEVPETPVTAFTGAKSALGSPHNGSISKSGGYNNFDANSLLDTSTKLPPPMPTKSLSRSEKAVCAGSEDEHKKKHLLPHLPHMPQVWKSKFRREVPKDGDFAENDSDGASESGSDVVVPPLAAESGINEITKDAKPKKRRKKRAQHHGVIPRPPSEIGGPDTVPSLCQSQVSREESVGIVNEVAYLYSTTKTSNGKESEK